MQGKVLFGQNCACSLPELGQGRNRLRESAPGGVAVPRRMRQASEQYFTSSHTFSHFFRQTNGRPQTTQSFDGRSDFFFILGMDVIKPSAAFLQAFLASALCASPESGDALIAHRVAGDNRVLSRQPHSGSGTNTRARPDSGR